MRLDRVGEGPGPEASAQEPVLARSTSGLAVPETMRT
jgi:hypothetical protein